MFLNLMSPCKYLIYGGLQEEAKFSFNVYHPYFQWTNKYNKSELESYHYFTVFILLYQLHLVFF